MRRKRLLVVLGILAGAAFVVGLVRQERHCTYQVGFGRIEQGMTREQVEVILGPSPCPPTPLDDLDGEVAPLAAFLAWNDGRTRYTVFFSTENWRVVEKHQEPEPTLWTKLRRSAREALDRPGW
jgi:hypothetical protein